MTDLRGIEAGAEVLDIVDLTVTRMDLSFSRGGFRCFQSEIYESAFDAVQLIGSPQRTALASGEARLTRVMRDGVSLPDQWPGEAEWNATEERYLDRYRRAFLAGDAETMPLDPYDPDLE
ncbi:hypothetical protein [Clavibacter tessellarius]|uniref:hypothetical protein n=1 Tax=Clavibacter tessellarius TaxID=31965 RepID=UPI00324D38F4